MKDISFIIAQLLGVCVIVSCIIMPQMKIKSGILICSLIASTLQIAMFFLLGAYSGMRASFSTALRTFVFFLYARAEKRAPFPVMIGLICLHLYAILPKVITNYGVDWKSSIILICIVNIYGQWQENLTITRLASVVSAIAFGVYSLLSTAYVNAINEVLLIASATLALWRYREKGEKDGRQPAT